MSSSPLPSPIRGMTGYARVRRGFPWGEVSVTIKTVNHRALDLHFHLPVEAEPFEPAFRTAIRSRVARGHVDVHVSLERTSADGGAALNVPMLRAYGEALRQAADILGVSCPPPDLNAALSLPGMITLSPAREDGAGTEKDLLDTLSDAIGALDAFRLREGSATAEVIRKHNAAILAGVAAMEEIRTRALPILRDRLQGRLRELLDGSPLDPQRLAQEAALIADRGDIGEELERLKMHAAQLGEIVLQGGEVGKRLDFLLQEMNRESNTILSKTGGVGELGLRLTELALAVKADIEKIREQSLNLE